MGTDENQVLANLRKGTLESCLLALLRGGEMYGLEIAQQLSELGLIASEGSLYPLVARLERRGLVASSVKIGQDTGRQRRYYALTDQGEKQLARFANVWAPFSATITSLVGRETD